MHNVERDRSELGRQSLLRTLPFLFASNYKSSTDAFLATVQTIFGGFVSVKSEWRSARGSRASCVVVEKPRGKPSFFVLCDGTGRDATALRIYCGGGGAASFVCCVCRAVARGTFVVPHA